MADQGRFSEAGKAALQAANEAIGGALIPQPKPMTDKEWAVLRALAATRRGLWRRPGDLVTEGKLPRDSSLPGIHQTAASLVRKGWARRRKDGGYHGHVCYAATDAGRKALDDRARQGARDAAAFVRAGMKTRAARLAGVQPRLPDPDKGEYLTENNGIRVCKACVPGSRATRHICGLSGLQAMFPLGGAR